MPNGISDIENAFADSIPGVMGRHQGFAHKTCISPKYIINLMTDKGFCGLVS